MFRVRFTTSDRWEGTLVSTQRNDENTIPHETPTVSHGLGTAALIIGIVSVVLVAAGVLRPPATALFLFALLVLGASAGIAAVVLAIIARRQAKGKAVAGGILGAIGAVVGASMFATILIGAIRPPVVEVELHASGDSGFTVEFTDDGEPRSAIWYEEEEWGAKFGERESTSEMTVTAVEPGDVTCRIVRDGEVVAEESSSSGTVTCSFSAE